MSEAMHGGERPASPEQPALASSGVSQLTTSEAESSTDTLRVLSDEAREQLTRAMEQEGLHVGRMAKKAGRPMAEDMWQNIIISFHNRLLNHGPVDHLESYLNRCVTTQLSKLRDTIEVVVGDEELDVLRAQSQSDPQLDDILQYNRALIEAARGIRDVGILTDREADVYLLAQVLGEDNGVVAKWLDPPSTPARVATLKWKAVRKVNKARREGKLTHLGFDPPQDGGEG